MSLNVSSWFVAQAAAGVCAPGRHFFIGGSDYSAQVLRWPTIRYSARTIDLGTGTVRLVNDRGQFNFFVNSQRALTTSCELALGFADAAGNEERVSVYLGGPSNVAFHRDGTELSLQLQGKTRRLHDTTLGTDTASGALAFTGSAWHPSDLAWTLVTCQGGLSALQSSANPDLHYGEWLAWRDVDMIRDVRVQGRFTGEKAYQVLDVLAQMDGTTISFRDGQLRFNEVYAPYSGNSPALPQAAVLDMSLSIDPSRIINAFYVETEYDPVAGRFQSFYSKVHSRSQQDYGPRSGRFGSRSVWFASAADGRYMAEDAVGFALRPQPRVKLRTTLAGGVHRGVGEVVTLTHSLLALSAREFRITEMGLNLDEGTLDFELEQAWHRPWQYMATVAASYNMMPETLQAVGSDTFLAATEGPGTSRILRSGAAGELAPLNIYGTALLVLHGSEVIFGGPPSSGSTQSVLARSSDAGSSAVTVATLNPGISKVYDLFQVASGTLLASATSGGIWRSTDAGSSWALTQVISGHFHISRFFAPYPGTIWGCTGYSNATGATGARIWESVDAGATWTPKHTVTTTGDDDIGGIHYLTGSEFLLSTWGLGTSQRRTLRSKWASVNSIAWTLVNCRSSFTHIVGTASGDLLYGFHEHLASDGGSVHRSTDQGSSWSEESKLAKQGNVRLWDNGDGTLEAFIARTSAGYRTDRYRNYHPTEIP